MLYLGFSDKQMNRIEPEVLESYLQKTGWKKSSYREEGNFSVYRQRNESSGFEVLVLHDGIEAPGYVRRMAETVTEIARFENRHRHEVFEDLASNPAATLIAS